MRTTKKDVLARLAYMSKVVGVEYDADFCACFGGWSMWLAGTCGCKRGFLGFDYRKSTAEFMEYMNGIIYGVLYLKQKEAK